MELLDKYKEILSKDLFLNLIKEELKSCSLNLTGGAINDILSGKNPKDYDFEYSTDTEREINKSNKFKLIYTSSTALTYEYHSNIIQLIFKDRSEFPYTIEKARYNLRNGDLHDFDSNSFENKLLVPNKKAFLKRETARTVLRRLLKWQAKGYNIHPITYESILRCAFISSKKLDSDSIIINTEDSGSSDF